MWFIIGSIIGIILLALAFWVRHRIVMDTVAGFGVSGAYTYMKYGLWHLGISAG